MLARLSRLLFIFRLMVLEGWGRASLLKKVGFFKSQGTNCYFGIYNFGTEPFLLSFGDNVIVATGVRFVNHDMAAQMVSTALFGRSDRLSIYGEIKIGSNVFIGADSIILPGVTIGDNVVIGAGSVISKDLESNGIYVGASHFVKEFSEYKELVLSRSNGTRKLLSNSKYLVDNGFCLVRKDDIEK